MGIRTLGATVSKKLTFTDLLGGANGMESLFNEGACRFEEELGHVVDGALITGVGL